jgi:hypothetical protein
VLGDVLWCTISNICSSSCTLSFTAASACIMRLSVSLRLWCTQTSTNLYSPSIERENYHRKKPYTKSISAYSVLVNISICVVTGGSTVTTAWRVLGLRIEDTASRYGG